MDVLRDAVFDALLARPQVRLAEPPTAPRVRVGAGADGHVDPEGDADARTIADGGEAAATLAEPAGGYLVLETYPTATWRAVGLAPLPAKARRPDVAEWYARLSAAFDLPRDVEVHGHDDLQAIVAALAAVGVAGGPAGAAWHGHPCRVADGVRVEGGIWVASKL